MLEKTATSSEPTKGYQSTGRGGLQRTKKCQDPCLACGSADLSKVPPRDQMILLEAQEKHENQKKKKLQKKTKQTKTSEPVLPPFKFSRVRKPALSAKSGSSDR